MTTLVRTAVFFGVTAPSRLMSVTTVKHVPKKRISDE
jgi:hypothetical protein